MNDKFESVACCKAMYSELVEGTVIYDEVYGSFHYPGKRIFAYCPNCGTKLPYYSEEYWDALEQVTGKDACDIEEQDIPESFKTDEWWRNRGIVGVGTYWKMYDPIKLGNYD